MDINSLRCLAQMSEALNSRVDRKRFLRRMVRLTGGLVVGGTFAYAVSCDSEEGALQSEIVGDSGDTAIKLTGRIVVESIGEFDFDPAEVRTTRPDLFQEGHFSVFDILVHLAERGRIDLRYHLDASMDTHVIDSLNDRGNWWYIAYSDGGWPEKNVFRMDHYPYKDKMYVRILEEDSRIIEQVHQSYRSEVSRRKRNGGKAVIPEIIVDGLDAEHSFEGVEVRAHDLRDDIFQPGVVTAADAIMTLGDENELTYDLRWMESIGGAEVVKSYWVSRIDEDDGHMGCGFVYECGPLQYRGSRGNHIHLPSDSRIINSPDYMEWFWVCL